METAFPGTYKQLTEYDDATTSHKTIGNKNMTKNGINWNFGCDDDNKMSHKYFISII